jgi:hypothetical protein
MWLKLTMYDGSPKRINFNLVEAYGPDEKEGSSIDTGTGTYRVKESTEEIEKKLFEDKGWK